MIYFVKPFLWGTLRRLEVASEDGPSPNRRHGKRTREFFRIVWGQGVVCTRIDHEGRDPSAFAVDFDVWTGNARRSAVRYDSAHGRPHRDTLDWAGNVVAEEWMDEGLTDDAALTEAIKDVDANWPSYRDGFLGRKP